MIPKSFFILLIAIGVTVGLNDACAKPGKGKGKAKGHAHAPGLAKKAGNADHAVGDHKHNAAVRAQHKKERGNCQCQVCTTHDDGTVVTPATGSGTTTVVDDNKYGSTKGGKGNNGVGNGIDPAPPGNPRENDGDGTAPGAPGNKKGGGVKGGPDKDGKGGKPEKADKGKGGKPDKAGGGKGKGGPKR